MPAKKPAPPPHAEISPLLSYRINDPIAVHTTGLAATQQLEAAKLGDLAGEMPVRLTSSPRAPFIWIGQQLLNIQAARLAKARAEAERLAAERTNTSQVPPKTSRKRKAAA
jgi:hypothetical protein